MAADPAAFLFTPTDWRAKLVQLYDAEARRLQSAYQRTLRRLELQHGEFASALAELERTGTLTAQAVRDLPATARLMAALDTELDGFARYLDGQLGGMADDALQLGAQAAEAMTFAASGTAQAIVQAAWRRPDPEMLARMVRYVDSPAMRRGLARFGEAAVEQLSDTLLALTAQGKGSRAIASAMRNGFDVPYSWAESIARTTQAYSYRGASVASYRVNSDIVRGWRWIASLDRRTCAHCVAEHGTLHKLDEDFSSHHRCRCTAVPEVIGSRLFEDMETGPMWFDRQSTGLQRQMLGRSKYDAYQSGAWDWSAASAHYDSEIFGQMRREATLIEMGLPRVKR